MTTPVIASLVPGGVGLPEQRRTTRSRTVRSRRPLPLTEVPTRRTATTVYGVAALDCHGRIADRVVLRALGWPPGTRLEMRGNREQIIVRACADGRSSVTPEDHVRLPATLRHRHGLNPVIGSWSLLSLPLPRCGSSHPPRSTDCCRTLRTLARA